MQKHQGTVVAHWTLGSCSHVLENLKGAPESWFVCTMQRGDGGRRLALVLAAVQLRFNILRLFSPARRWQLAQASLRGALPSA